MRSTLSDAFTAEGQVRVIAFRASDTLLQLNTSGLGGAESAIFLLNIRPSALTEGDFVL